MRQIIRDFVKIVSETLPINEPIYEFGSLQVQGQEGFADLRTFFQGKVYVGCDILEGPGVDQIMDLRNIALPSESVGTVIVVDTLEHVEFFREAIKEIHRILKPEGIAIVSSVMRFPIHYYPHDYWRFTPEGLRSVFKIFHTSFIDFAGDSTFPHTVIGVGFKNPSLGSIEEFRQGIYLWKRFYIDPSQKRNRKDFVKLFTPPVIVSLYRRIRRVFHIL